MKPKNIVQQFELFITGYVEDIFETLVEAVEKDKLQDAMIELKAQVPPPMNTMLVKQPREEAIQKKKARDNMQLSDVPPTNPGKDCYKSCET